MLPYLFTQLTALSADGNTASIELHGLENEITLYLGTGATWGSGTLKAQVSYDGGTTWVDVPSASWTSGSASSQLAKFSVKAPLLRFNLAGSTSPTLNVEVKAERSRYGNLKAVSFAADGNSASFMLPEGSDTIAWAAQGTWGSGTLALQVSPDGGTTWRKVDSATANALKHTANVTDLLARFSLSGSTNPALTAYVVL